MKSALLGFLGGRLWSTLYQHFFRYGAPAAVTDPLVFRQPL